MTRFRASIAAVAAGALFVSGCGSGGDNGSGSDGASGGGGSDYPTREITYVIPYETGGSTDPIGRVHASGLGEALGTSVIVENRPGGSATIGTSTIVTGDPDGYTIGMTTSSAVGLQPLLMGNLPYDTADDYQPLIKLADLPTILTVRADAPWQTIEEFVQEAKADPGALRVSVSGAGTTPDLNVQQLNRAAGIDLTSVPFTGGGGEALVALLSGEVEANAGYAPSVRGQVAAGELRVLGVFYGEPYAAFPEAQTTADAGYESAALPVSYYAIAPNGLPDEVLARLVSASEDVVASDEFAAFAEENGYILNPITTDEVRKDIQEYRDRYQPLLDIIQG